MWLTDTDAHNLALIHDAQDAHRNNEPAPHCTCQPTPVIDHVGFCLIHHPHCMLCWIMVRQLN